MSFREKLYHVTGRKTPEEKLKERIRIIRELVKEKRMKANTKQENTHKLKKEFYLDNLTVADKKGKVVTKSGNGGAFEEIIDKGLHDYMQKEFPEAEIYTVRSNGKNKVIYNTEERTYMMETPGSISIPEIRRIANQIQKGEIELGSGENA